MSSPVGRTIACSRTLAVPGGTVPNSVEIVSLDLDLRRAFLFVFVYFFFAAGLQINHTCRSESRADTETHGREGGETRCSGGEKG